ncbi:MAG: hypothetical protein H6671_16430 [Anaerolineaceae bacterium]|nr:hypothetical protein [Anaerolineaceae bacterium]
MTTQDTDERWQEIRSIHHEYEFFYQIGGGLLLVLIGVWIGTNLFALAEDTGYFTNVYTEVLSIFVTVFILDRLAQRREDRNREIDLREQLVRDASSLVNDVALNAIRQIRKRGQQVVNREDLQTREAPPQRRLVEPGADGLRRHIAGGRLNLVFFPFEMSRMRREIA